LAVPYYESLGVAVSRVMTDNGSCYRSASYKAVRLANGVRRQTPPSRASPDSTASEQQNQNDDQQYQAEAAAVVMVWRTNIKAAPTENDNQNNQE
jgi:transposase InsO family protein